MKHAWLMLALCGLLAAEVPTIPLARVSGAEPLDPASPVWKNVPSVRMALYRALSIETTETPSDPEITAVQVQLVEAGGHVVVRLEWKDESRDVASAAAAEDAWESESSTAAPEAGGFFDACAVLMPENPVAEGEALPSLRAGNASSPVLFHRYDIGSSAVVLEASGPGTSHPTDSKFPARAHYTGDSWQVIMELPAFPAGTPLAVAVWNGSQHDIDGRRYFSIWYRVR